MSETPNPPVPGEDDQQGGAGSAPPEGAPGAEVGMTEEEGSTFEPEEDPKP
jgi:hypothetical protein